jgi:type I restriction enzyme M protein
VDNIEMGLLFEDLIRRFNEQANETAGDHFTPREVIQPHGEPAVHARR